MDGGKSREKDDEREGWIVQKGRGEGEEKDGGMGRTGEKQKAKIHFLCRNKDISWGRGHAATSQDPLYTHYD